MTKAKITNPAYKHSIVVPESPQEAVFSAPTPEENPPQQAPEAQESTQEQEETTPPETETVPVRYRRASWSWGTTSRICCGRTVTPGTPPG